VSHRKPLPVLFLIPSLERGGAEGQLIMLVNALDRRRFQPIVCSFSPVEPQRRGEIDCEVVHLGLTSLFRPSAVATWARLEALVRQRGIRVIQAWFLRAEVLAVLTRFAHRHRVSVVLAKRDLEHDSYGVRERLLARLAHWGSDVLVSNAGAVKSYLESAWKVAPDRSRVIYNGIVLERFVPASPQRRAAAKKQLGFTPEELVVTAVTHLIPVKGAETFVHAAALVLPQMPRARFAVVGGGQLLPGLEERARSLGISTHVRFVGEITDVRLHLEASDIGALSSLSEGLPNAVLEYMAMGLPIVATNVGGTRELVGPDGECGFLVPAGQAAPFAERVLELFRDPMARARMGERGRIRAERMFDARHMAQEYEELFDRLSTRQQVEVSVHAPR
jgi:glycosyltransferase involved in cell wall biosynthesis